MLVSLRLWLPAEADSCGGEHCGEDITYQVSRSQCSKNLDFRQFVALSNQNIRKLLSYQPPGLWQEKTLTLAEKPQLASTSLPGSSVWEAARWQDPWNLEYSWNIFEIFFKYSWNILAWILRVRGCKVARSLKSFWNILEIFLPGSFLSEVVRWQDPWNRLFQSNETPSISIVF